MAGGPVEVGSACHGYGVWCALHAGFQTTYTLDQPVPYVYNYTTLFTNLTNCAHNFF